MYYGHWAHELSSLTYVHMMNADHRAWNAGHDAIGG